MDERKTTEIAKSIFECMTDEQKSKARECKTDEDFSAFMDGLELELSDDAAEVITGGVQAGDVMRTLRTKFVNAFQKPKLPPVDERFRRPL